MAIVTSGVHAPRMFGRAIHTGLRVDLTAPASDESQQRSGFASRFRFARDTQALGFHNCRPAEGSATREGSSAKTSGSCVPRISASTIVRPETPSTLDATEESLMPAS